MIEGGRVVGGRFLGRSVGWDGRWWFWLAWAAAVEVEAGSDSYVCYGNRMFKTFVIFAIL